MFTFKNFVIFLRCENFSFTLFLHSASITALVRKKIQEIFSTTFEKIFFLFLFWIYAVTDTEWRKEEKREGFKFQVNYRIFEGKRLAPKFFYKFRLIGPVELFSG